MLAIIQQAAPAEPELAALWHEITERRAANMRRFVADLASVTPLRIGRKLASAVLGREGAVIM